MKRLALAAAAIASLSLGACGTINSFTAGALSSAQANSAQTIANIQKADDLKFSAWANSACAMNLGALQRNATGNPNAVKGVLELCPVPNMGIITVNQAGGTVGLTVPSINGKSSISIGVNQ